MEEDMLAIWRLCMELTKPVLLRRRWCAGPSERGETERAKSLAPSLSEITVDSWELHWWGCDGSIGAGGRTVRVPVPWVEELDPGLCETDHGKSWLEDAPRLNTTGVVNKAWTGS